MAVEAGIFQPILERIGIGFDKICALHCAISTSSADAMCKNLESWMIDEPDDNKFFGFRTDLRNNETDNEYARKNLGLLGLPFPAAFVVTSCSSLGFGKAIRGK